MKRFTAEREVAGTIPGARPHTCGLKKTKKIWVLPLPANVQKRLDLRVARTTTYIGDPVSSWRPENSVPQLALSC